MGNQVASQPLGYLIAFGCGIFTCYVYYKVFRRSRVHQVRNELKNNEIDLTDEESPGEDGSYKLALVVRNDLKMGKGKAAAQCSHAAVMAYKQAEKKLPTILKEWSESGQPKIVLKVNSEKEMLDLADEAQRLKLLVSVVRDAGRTQVASGSKTVLAIGPGLEDTINSVTGQLKLF